MDETSGKPTSGSSALDRLVQSLATRLRHHSAAILSLAVRAGAVLAGFAVTFLIGRSMGASGTGQFALVSQTAVFLGVIGLIGLDVAVVRHFAKTLADKVPLALSAVLQVGGLSFGLLLVIAAALWFGSTSIWGRFFGEIVPTDLLPILCILLFARGGTQLLGALLRSQHQFTLGQIIAALAIPASTATALAFGWAQTVPEALWAAAFGGLIAIVIALFALSRHVSRQEDALNTPPKTVLASSLPLWGVGIANSIGDWYGLAVSASVLGASEAGLYRVAIQIAAILQIISVALFAVYSAKISTAHHAGKIRQVALLARSAVRLSTATALPAAFCLIAGSGFVLAQIGDEFVAALPLVYILVIGQLAFTLTGPCGLVLAMSGQENINLAITIVGTLALLICVPIAAQFAGMEGIALCISVIMLLRNVCAYLIVRYKLGISIWAGTVRSTAKGSP